MIPSGTDTRSRETQSLPGETPRPHALVTHAAGTILAGRFEIRGLLGSGGYAAVYRAFDRFEGREIALKLLHQHLAGTSAVERLRQELRVRGISSRNVVRIYDIGSEGDYLYLTMELVRGESLRQRLRREPLTITEALHIISQLLDGLRSVHSGGVVHRDLKPENILLDKHGIAKIADFGLAHFLEGEQRRLTATGAVLGSTDYMAPEQVRGHRGDARSDLYAVGIILFEMLTGQAPFAAETRAGAALARLHARAPNPRSVVPSVPLWLANLTLRLLEERPEDRFQDVGAVQEAMAAKQVKRQWGRMRRHLALGAVILLFLFLIGLTSYRLLQPTPLRFARLSADEHDGIAAIAKDGSILWRRNVWNDIANRYALVRLPSHTQPVLATALSKKGDYRLQTAETLSLLDPDTGQTVDEIRLPTAASSFPGYSLRYILSSLHSVDLDSDGIDEVLATYQQVPECVSYTVLYEPRTRRARVVFVATGGHHFVGAYDVDGDGRRDLLFLGINNGYNWINALAAVRVLPWVNEPLKEDESSVRSPDAMATTGNDVPASIFYALLPRGRVSNDPGAVSWDVTRRLVTISLWQGRTAVLKDGFLVTDASPLSAAQRERQRRTAYAHDRESRRLFTAGKYEEAAAEGRAAVAAARDANDPILVEALSRDLGKTLIAGTAVSEGESLLQSIQATSENASEVAYDAAVAFHLRGDLARAVAYYEAGVGRGGSAEAGKSKHEFIQGEVFALTEEGRWPEALAAIGRFHDAYVTENSDWSAIYREFVRWRMGQTPQLETIPVGWNPTDLQRYWTVEFRNSRGESPTTLLPIVDSLIAENNDPRGPLLSLRAVLLSRLGRSGEASTTAARALELTTNDAKRSIISRGHISVVRERHAKLGAHAS
jgi:serine/threonine protein kinase